MIRTIALACIVSFIIGGCVCWFVYAKPRVVIAETNLDTRTDERDSFKGELEKCKQDVASAEASLETLRAQRLLRAEQAKSDINKALLENRTTGDTVQKILAELTPAGMDACLAASNAFDRELTSERQK